MIAVIKSDVQYREVLERIEHLVEIDPVPDSREARELEVLAVLVQDYERRAFPLAPPSPLAALRLRMDQLGLSPKDLMPYLGARSKVSEVLTGKRPLSIGMIRSLHTGLSIPLESLVSEESEEPSEARIEWDRFPVRELLRLGWLEGDTSRKGSRIGFAEAQALMEEFFAPVGGPGMAMGVLHKTDFVRTSRATDRYALAAWAAYVRRCSEDIKEVEGFRLEDWHAETFRELRSLSRYDVGPRLAVQFLCDRGVVVVIAPHLKRTRLDGAAMLRTDGTPVIGLTLRHNRLDNFWFTLFHELMHIVLHLKGDREEVSTKACFIDDLDVSPDSSGIEREADAAARDALVPSRDWESSAVRYAVAPVTVSQLAREIGVADAIVAGRVRFERRNYRLLSSMVGAGQVRSLFHGIEWPAENS